MDEILNKRFPCRSETIKSIGNLIGNEDEAYPASIYIYGHAGTGKTAIIQEYLQQASKQGVLGVHLNCIECYTSKILLENILDELGVDESASIKCDTFKEFVEELRRWHTNQNKSTPNGFVIALDNAERLRDMDANILPSLLQLQHLVGLNLCVILISQIQFEKFYCKTGLPEVQKIFFPQYSKAETQRILSVDFEKTMNALKERLKRSHAADSVELEKRLAILKTISIDFFSNYLNLFLSVFYKACRDVPELKITARKCFFIYIEPVLDGNVDSTDVSRLWRNISQPLKTALSQVYLRIDHSVGGEIGGVVPEHSLLDQNVRNMAMSLELPFYGKYLLIAGFLASHNAAKQDKRLFVKNHGKQRKRVQNINANAKTSEKMSTSVGPKSFSIDRLLAIFYAILDEKVGLTCNLLSQISTLVHLKLLCYTSGENNIMDGSSRLQCTVSLEFVLQIGKVVGFNVRQYLCDFM